MEDKINITVSDKVGELIIRHGEALDQRDPVAIRINGTIDAPSIFLNAKKESMKPLNSHLLVDINKGVLEFTSNEKDPFNDTIIGTLKRSEALKKIGVNDQGKFYSDKEMAKFIRQHIFYFADPKKANELIDKLMKFTAKISTDITNNADLKGNMRVAFERQTKVEIPDSIEIKCKIFEGLEPETFIANIGIEVDMSSMKFYFDSPMLFEMEEKIKKEVLDKESQIFKDWGCAVINI